MLDDLVEKHESYGMVGLSRVSSSHNQNFFGSSIKHNHYITLHIKRAQKRRSLNRDWFHGNEELIEIRLTPNQFAEMITSLNVGDGVPCTLQYVHGKRMEEPPEVTQRQQFEDEFKKTVYSQMAEAEAMVADVKNMLESKATIGKKDREELLKKVSNVVQHVKGTMPFIQGQFNEAMDKTVTEAKSEVETFFTQKIQSLGIQALEGEVALALQGAKDAAVFQLPDPKTEGESKK